MLPPVSHTSGPRSPLVNLSHDLVDSFFKGASTPKTSVQTFPLLAANRRPQHRRLIPILLPTTTPVLVIADF